MYPTLTSVCEDLTRQLGVCHNSLAGWDLGSSRWKLYRSFGHLGSRIHQQGTRTDCQMLLTDPSLYYTQYKIHALLEFKVTESQPAMPAVHMVPAVHVLFGGTASP